MKRHWVMDIETMSDFFCAVFEHYKEESVTEFVISFNENQIKELVDFINENVKNDEWHISFNGLDFDAQVIQYIIDHAQELITLDSAAITDKLYKVAQDIIYRKNNGEFALYSHKQLKINQIDLFKLNHWDNPAKSSSLKWLEYTLDWHNVEEMPIHHSDSIDTVEKQEMVLSYCRNDVKFTKKIMEYSKSQIALRGVLTKEYGINLYSASEPRISKELFKYFLSKATGISSYELNGLRTNRTLIKVNDIILDYVNFKTPELQALLAKFRTIELDPKETKGGFAHSVTYKGMQTDFGLGGLHGARSGIFEAKNGMIIMSSDVVSYYPNLAIKNKWAPAHLPKEEFCEQYEWFFTERKKIPKKDPKNYVYKIILNSTYGLSNDKNSFLYDPEFTMRITINGQLSLCMLYEMIAEGIPGAIPIMQNTDGLEMMIPEQHKDKYLEICAEWEKITQLSLEHDQYQKMIIGDVNNYIGINTHREADQETLNSLKEDEPYYIYTDTGYSPVKCKGRFEFHHLALHKNKSFLIIRKALYNYFVFNTPVDKTILESRNIVDFCGGIKAKGDWRFTSNCMIKGVLITEPLQKIVRYYVSNKGCKILKQHRDGRIIQVESGRWLQTTLNKLDKKDWDSYDINYDYYINNAIREIMNVCPEKIAYQQLELSL